MTLYYSTSSWNSQPQISEDRINLWKHIANKKNWRITQQDLVKEDVWHDVTRRETLEGAESAIDASIAHYAKKLEYIKGPKVVKTFE